MIVEIIFIAMHAISILIMGIHQGLPSLSTFHINQKSAAVHLGLLLSNIHIHLPPSASRNQTIQSTAELNRQP